MDKTLTTKILAELISYINSETRPDEFNIAISVDLLCDAYREVGCIGERNADLSKAVLRKILSGAIVNLGMDAKEHFERYIKELEKIK